MMRLTEHRAETAHLPHQPFHRGDTVAAFAWHKHPRLLSGKTGWLLIENRLRRAFNIMVDDRRHAVVGTERKKGRVRRPCRYSLV